MGDLVQFPQRKETVEVEMVEPPAFCEGILHIFDEVPGTCRCGEETWGADGLEPPRDGAIGIHHVA